MHPRPVSVYREDLIRAALRHHHKDVVGGTTTQLQSDTTYVQSEHRWGTPNAIHPRACTTGDQTSPVSYANAHADLPHTGIHEDAHSVVHNALGYFLFIEYCLEYSRRRLNALRKIESAFHLFLMPGVDDPRIRTADLMPGSRAA